MQRARMHSGLATLLFTVGLACGPSSSNDAGSNEAASNGTAANEPPSSVAAAAPNPPSEVVAEIAGKTYTLAEVDERARRDDPDVFQGLYDARKRAVDALVEEKLLGDAATAAGVSQEDLVEREVTAKAQAIDDASVRAFFDENEGSMGGQTFETLEPRIRQFMTAQALRDRRRAYVTSLKQAAMFEFHLDPPRQEVTVAAGERTKGPEDAPITIVEYADFQCPFCARALPTLAKIEETYGDKVRFVFRDYPLAMHPEARGAAEASRCAHAQGKFWAFHDKAFENLDKLGAEDLERLASEVELDLEKYKACVAGDEYEAAVTADEKRGAELGVSGTPAFFVNGRFLSGAQPFEEFQEIIEDELARK